MKERRLLLFLTFLPIALAVIVWDLDTDFANNSDPKTEQAYTELPLTILERAQLTQFDQNGLQSQQVSSPRLASSEDNEIINIDQPAIQLHTEDGLWTATSLNGVFHQSENRLVLNGEVTLKKLDSNMPVVMLTDHLDYYPDSRLVEADTPVTIEATGHDIRSDGISIDLANSVYVLTSNVRSRHEPL